MRIDPQTTTLASFRTFCLTKGDMADLMFEDYMSARENKMWPKVVFTSNGQGISLNASNSELSTPMKAVDIIHANVESLVLASKLVAKQSIPESIATTDLFHSAAVKQWLQVTCCIC
jgi:N-acetylglucosaminyldiphosphoundecaprenol N-acetyl-beta-D-mannosaminyltransferase